MSVAPMMKRRGGYPLAFHHAFELVPSLHLHSIEPVGRFRVGVVRNEFDPWNAPKRFVVELAVLNAADARD